MSHNMAAIQPTARIKTKKEEPGAEEEKGKNGSWLAARRAQIGRPGLPAAQRVDWSVAMTQLAHVTQTRRRQQTSQQKVPHENKSSAPAT